MRLGITSPHVSTLKLLDPILSVLKLEVEFVEKQKSIQ